jgi:hypothetical protein
MIKNAVLAGILIGATLATNVLAGENVCLTRSRLVSSRAAGDNTIEMIDRQMNRFTVRVQAPCPALDDLNARIILGRTWRNLSCLDSSVVINVAATGRGTTACRVASVQAGSPTQANASPTTAPPN